MPSRVFTNPVMSEAYNRVVRDDRETHARALCGEYLKACYPTADGWLLGSETYIWATEGLKDQGHKWFKIDFTNEKLVDGGFVTHMVVEVKPKRQSEAQDEAATLTLEKIAHSVVIKEDLSFVWAVQWYGVQLCLKRYSLDTGLKPVRLGELGADFVDVKQHDRIIAATFEAIKPRVPVRSQPSRHAIASTSDRHLQAAQHTTASTSDRHLQASQHTTASTNDRHLQPSQHTTASTGDRHSETFQSSPQLREVKAVPMTKDGKEGYKVEVNGARMFVPNDRWAERSIRNDPVYFCKELNVYFRK